jgi:hypothetical protein
MPKLSTVNGVPERICKSCGWSSLQGVSHSTDCIGMIEYAVLAESETFKDVENV